ncbi:MAG: hypothetical protein ACRYG7_07665 [Janthinobacterium lividum]
MSKQQGLKFLQSKFNWQVMTLTNIILYKNLPAETENNRLIGLAKFHLLAQECKDLRWQLGLIRDECLTGLSGLEPDGYDPFFDGDGNPPLETARPYDPYREIHWIIDPGYTPHGLGMNLSPGVFDTIGMLLGVHDSMNHEEGTLLTREGGTDEGEWRPMTAEELTKMKRKEQQEFMDGTLFTVGFNEDMARLRQLVVERGSLAEILDLVGPEPVEEEA